MGNMENLKGKGFDARTTEEAREIGRKGGIASGEARREKRDLKRACDTLLEKDYTDKNGITLTGAEAIVTKQFEKALKGNARAFELIRDTAGQKPTEKINVVNDIDQAIIDEVEAMVLGCADELEEPMWKGDQVGQWEKEE